MSPSPANHLHHCSQHKHKSLQSISQMKLDHLLATITSTTGSECQMLNTYSALLVSFWFLLWIYSSTALNMLLFKSIANERNMTICCVISLSTYFIQHSNGLKSYKWRKWTKKGRDFLLPSLFLLGSSPNSEHFNKHFQEVVAAAMLLHLLAWMRLEWGSTPTIHRHPFSQRRILLNAVNTLKVDKFCQSDYLF